MARIRAATILLGAALAAVAATPHTPDAVCPAADDPMAPARALRSLSLDLRGEIPALSDYEQLGEDGEIPASLIDSWLGSDAFADRAVRHHRDLLWNNITNLRLTSNNFILSTSGGLHYRRNVAVYTRGDRVPCLDEPARWDDDGAIITTRQPDGTRREGYVWVNPYWDPSTPVKVCAYDAQTAAVASSGQRCDRREAGDEPECGCGPQLRSCALSGSTDSIVAASFGEDLERRIASLIQEDRPYLDLFDGREAWVNGPIVHYLRYQAGIYNNVSLLPLAIPTAELPDLSFTDVDTWEPITLPPHHAGILTSPAFLLRFQTNRARANRFFNAFMCEPFQPPAGGLPAPEEGKAPPLDLQQRDGCKYCHAQLEPAASYWGRWTQSGAGWLDPDAFPPQRADCLACATGSGGCSADCRAYYVVDALTDEEDPWLGWLRSYEFRRPDHMINVEVGPRVLAAGAVVDGRLPSCVARTAFTWLMGRAPAAEEQPWVDDLALDFVRSNYSYRHLVKAIVTSDTYGRPK